MAYEEKKSRPSDKIHHVILENRSKLTISGVEDVERFDENLITMATVEGALVIRGTDLHIEKLSLDGGDLLVEGTVESISYEERSGNQGGLLSRLFHP